MFANFHSAWMKMANRLARLHQSQVTSWAPRYINRQVNQCDIWNVKAEKISPSRAEVAQLIIHHGKCVFYMGFCGLCASFIAHISDTKLWQRDGAANNNKSQRWACLRSSSKFHYRFANYGATKKFLCRWKSAFTPAPARRCQLRRGDVCAATWLT